MILHVALYNLQFDAYVQLGGSSFYLLVSLVLTNCCCMVKVHSIEFFNNSAAILNFEHIAMHCGLSRVILLF